MGQIVLVDDFYFSFKFSFQFFLCLPLPKSLNLMFFVLCFFFWIVRQNCTFQLNSYSIFFDYFSSVYKTSRNIGKKSKILWTRRTKKNQWCKYASVSVSRSLNLDLSIVSCARTQSTCQLERIKSMQILIPKRLRTIDFFRMKICAVNVSIIRY